ncbi:DUF4190 domain-containing protein [Phragmitibacter flavus]|uniref:DUF4190 domain-containing protein n=1 Tax=Phragmitibacter flavus TaxID=2576071 RepID=A0A5R8KI07_9BACT|nr:DUF4190 domain-containing protein [Phragmitibacter flavus]TLD71870.1 DUF4190 domain-containing protein [Phragmitibacter flavus]
MEYHVGRNNQQLGQFTEEAIREGLFNGQFLKTDLVWTEGMEGWKPVAEVLAIESESPASALPPPPPPLETFSESPSSSTALPPAVPPSYSSGAAPTSNFPTLAVGKPTSGLAIASLILGITSLPTTFCYLGLFIGIAGIICGHIASGAIKRSNGTIDGKGIALAGLILSYIGTLISLLFIAIVAFAIIVADSDNSSTKVAIPEGWPTHADTTPSEGTDVNP